MKLNPLNNGDPSQMTETVFGTQHTLVAFLIVNRVFILTTALAENSIDHRLDTVIKQLKQKALLFESVWLYCGKGIIQTPLFPGS
ncbi:hypothetical protein [Peribacillus simplex]|uniref:hypothetical protein n=1 Tax=Peribacillus simplex TaxID=1478 RepID=UPI00366E9D8E